MKADLKTKWVEALRSGGYRQGRSSLRLVEGRQHAYCCLGVLCDVAGARWADEFGEDAFIGEIACRAGTASYLSRDMEKLVGLSMKQQRELAFQNDSGVNFDHVADYIEANIPTTDNSVAESSS